jgi:hypothetical protein
VAPGARTLLWAALVAGGHLALMLHFVDVGAVFSPEPIGGDDYDLHIGQTLRTIEGLDGWGHTWVYDVDLLAGQPAGTITDSGNKGWSLYTWALHRLGMNTMAALNSFALLAHLLSPLWVFWCARLFRMDVRLALISAALASLFWFFDSFSHWVWWIGMCSHAMASGMALVAIGLFFRFTDGGRAAWGLAAAPMVGVTLLVHPYSFFVMAPPMAWMLWRSARAMPRAHLAVVAAVVIVPVAINGYWLHNALSHWHYILDSAYYGQTGPRYLLADFLSIMLNPTDTGVIGTRTGFRFLICAAALCWLWRWRREDDARFAPVAITVVFLLLFSYVGGAVPGARQVQPYRFVMPATFMACLPAAMFLAHLLRGHFVSQSPWATRVALAIAALIGLQHLARDVLYFLPEVVPRAAPLIDGSPSPISAYGYITYHEWPHQIGYRLPHDREHQKPLQRAVAWVRDNVPAGERIAVQHSALGERIAWSTDVEVMGGFKPRNVRHALSNFFRRFDGEQVDAATLREYLHTFAVGWVITNGRREDFDRAEELLVHIRKIGSFHVYRSRLQPKKVLNGPGAVRAETNRIRVQGTRPERGVVLSYHFHEKLVCRPDCRVERVAAPLDAVGLIRVPPPHPAAFVIENGY